MELVENTLKRNAVLYGGDLLKERLGNAKDAFFGRVPVTGDGYKTRSPFAPSISHFLNFKLPVERSTQPQALQDILLHP